VANPADMAALHLLSEEPSMRERMPTREIRMSRIAEAARACLVALFAVFAISLGILPELSALSAPSEKFTTAVCLAPRADSSGSSLVEEHGRHNGQCPASASPPAGDIKTAPRRPLPTVSPRRLATTPIGAVTRNVASTSGVGVGPDAASERSTLSESSVRCLIASGRCRAERTRTSAEMSSSPADARCPMREGCYQNREPDAVAPGCAMAGRRIS
jgi:hypothetical protein